MSGLGFAGIVKSCGTHGQQAQSIGSEQRPAKNGLMPPVCKSCKNGAKPDQPLFKCVVCHKHFHSACHRPHPKEKSKKYVFYCLSVFPSHPHIFQCISSCLVDIHTPCLGWYPLVAFGSLLLRSNGDRSTKPGPWLLFLPPLLFSPSLPCLHIK